MTHTIADISISLDGFVAGPHPNPDNGLGTGGEALHTWAFSGDPDDRRVLREATARSGAVVLGRRLFDVVDGPYGWDDTSGYGAGEVEVLVAHADPRLTFHGRCLLMRRVVLDGRPVAHAAKELGVSRQCAHRWVNRYRAEGWSGL